jgi:hypothetical protein
MKTSSIVLNTDTGVNGKRANGVKARRNVLTGLAFASLALFLFSSPAYAQTGGPYPHIAPVKPKAPSFTPSITVKHPKPVSSNRIAVKLLKGIAFVSSAKGFNKNGVSPSVLNSEGLYFKSLPVLNNASFITSISSYINKPLTFKGLGNIISLVRSLYKSNGISFIDVTAPAQNVSSGVLQIVVMPYKVGSIKVSGNRYFSKNYIISQSGIRSDMPFQVRHYYRT